MLMLGVIRRLFCPHDYSITAESGVMFLRCSVCGHKTRGLPLQSGSDVVAHTTDRAIHASHASAPSSITSVTIPSVSASLGSSPHPTVVPSPGPIASPVSPLVNPSGGVSPSASRAGVTTRCRVLPGPQSKSIAPSVEAEVPTATVAIYACASAPDDDGGRELAELRRYADSRGWRVAFEQIEQHQTRRTRPALHRVVSDARLHGMDAVVVRQLDRLTRGSEQVVQLIDELTKSGVKVVSVGERTEATTSDSGLQTRLVNALAALDRVR